MINLYHYFSGNQLRRLPGIVAAAILLSNIANSRPAIGQEIVYNESLTQMQPRQSLPPVTYWPWKHWLWHQGDYAPRYMNGVVIFHHGPRHLPVSPPIYGPSFGYHAPCWRQVPVARRCLTCETIPEKSGTQASSSTLPSAFPIVPPAPMTPAGEVPEDRAAEDPLPDSGSGAPSPGKTSLNYDE